MVSGTVSGNVSKLWKLFGNFGGENEQNPSSMSTPSALDLDSATLAPGGLATRPASAMGQIDPAPSAELVDPVSASPLEPFAEKLCSVSSFLPVPLPMTVKRLFGGAREEIIQLTVEKVVPASQCCGESPIGKVLPFGIATV